MSLRKNHLFSAADNVVKNPPSHLVLGSITKQNVLQHYANIFEPGCGEPLGNPLHIEMVPSVTPVHAPRRRIPVSKLHKVNEELSRLCGNGTIKPVTQPTDWSSNILVRGETQWKHQDMYRSQPNDKQSDP